ncbi:MAG: hypothetical protein CL531_00130 [Aestuariibacter sp.]|nr:hypothetical protein [Aestuariibacter sp.]
MKLDIEQYLKTEFEVYPRMFRDVSSYLPSHENLSRLTNVPESYPCAKCDHGEMVIKSETCTSGDRYHYVCTHCRSESGPQQKSAMTAYWQGQVKSGSNTLGNPLVDSKVFGRKLQKWRSENLPKIKVINNMMTWNASLKWLKWVHVQHVKTADFESLDDTGKAIVLSIGYCIEALRKHAVEMMSEHGIDVANSAVQARIPEFDAKVESDRKSYYPQYQSRLPPVFRCRIKEKLGIGA